MKIGLDHLNECPLDGLERLARSLKVDMSDKSSWLPRKATVRARREWQSALAMRVQEAMKVERLKGAKR